MAVDDYPTASAFENASGDASFSFNASTGEFTVQDERKLKSRTVDLDGNTQIDLSAEDGVGSDIYVVENTGSSIPAGFVILPPAEFSEERGVIVKNRLSVSASVAASTSAFSFGTEGEDFVTIPSGESLTNFNSGGNLKFSRTSFPVPPEPTIVSSGGTTVSEISDGDTYAFTAETPWDTGSTSDPFNRGFNEFTPEEFGDLGDGQQFTIENRTDYPVRFPESDGKSPTEVVFPGGTAKCEVQNDTVAVLSGDTYDTSYEVVEDGTTAPAQSGNVQVIGQYVFKFNNDSFDTDDAISIYDLEADQFVLVDDPSDVEFPENVILVGGDTFYFSDQTGGGLIWTIDLNNVDPSTGEPFVTEIFDPDPQDTIASLDYYIDKQGNEYLYFMRSDNELLRFDIETQTVSSVLTLDQEIFDGSSNIDQRFTGNLNDFGTTIDPVEQKLYINIAANTDLSDNNIYKQVVVIDLVTETIEYFRRWEVSDEFDNPWQGELGASGDSFTIDGYREFNIQTLEVDPVPVDRSVVGPRDTDSDNVIVNDEGLGGNLIHFNTSSGDPGRYVHDLNRQRSLWWNPRNRGERPVGEDGEFIGTYKGDTYFIKDSGSREFPVIRVDGSPLA